MPSVNIYIRELLYRELLYKAEEKKISINRLVNMIIEEYFRKLRET